MRWAGEAADMFVPWLPVDDPLLSVTHGRRSSSCGHAYYYIDFTCG